MDASVRIARAHTPLGDQLLFYAMHGSEGLSGLFEFEVEMLSQNASIDMKAMLGKSLTLEILTTGAARYLDGQVARFAMLGRHPGASRNFIYKATVRPWLWYLTRTSDCKIFQNKAVTDILDEVLGEYGFAFKKKLSGSYRTWEYCVQYQETDFAFVSRLMEHEGIYYYFEHRKGQHTLVLTDDMAAHEPLPDYPVIRYTAAESDQAVWEEGIDQWESMEEIRPGTYVVDDFDFKKPKADLTSVRSQSRGSDHGSYEMYEWLGGYSESGDGEHYSRVRLEEAQAEAESDNGHANVRGMAPGYTFMFRNSPRKEDNRELLITAVTYNLREGGYASGSQESVYSFAFSAQPTSYPFRPPRLAPQPRTNGPQTATVVGPPGEDIWIDKYGRVKVQFRWDRYGQSNENSSCWVRVSSAWAGSNFGAVNHPRVGQEVIVDFIGGCPDRPLIIGRVYNADQMPPLELPAKATVSGFVSRTVKGDCELANHFVMDDKPGDESIDLHAQKDFNLTVENNETDHVFGTRNVTIEGADTYIGNTSLDETINGPHTLMVNQGGPQKITVNGGDQFIKVDGGNQYVDVIGGDQIIHVTNKRTDMVDGAEERFANSGLTETVTGNQLTTITANYTENVATKDVNVEGGAENYYISGDSTRIVGGKSHLYSVGQVQVDTVGGINLFANSGDVKITSPATVTVEADIINLKSNTKDVSYSGIVHTHAGATITTEADGSMTSIAPWIGAHAGVSYGQYGFQHTWVGATTNVGGFSADVKLIRMSTSATQLVKSALTVKIAGLNTKLQVLLSIF